jgi:uncharacterized protein
LGTHPDYRRGWHIGKGLINKAVTTANAWGCDRFLAVDTLWSQDATISQPLLAGMSAAARAYQVPIVGGHTNARSSYSALSVSILGRAEKLISSFTAQPGDRIDLRCKLHPKYPFWNAATTTDPNRLRGDLELLPKLAENGLCAAGKDISMGGVIGTTLMLLETSKSGAILDVDAIPRPPEIPFDRWLVSFPSYGFLLSVRPDLVPAVQEMFIDRNITCTDIGEVIESRQLIIKSQQESVTFWDFDREQLTGFGTPT